MFVCCKTLCMRSTVLHVSPHFKGIGCASYHPIKFPFVLFIMEFDGTRASLSIFFSRLYGTWYRISILNNHQLFIINFVCVFFIFALFKNNFLYWIYTEYTLLLFKIYQLCYFLWLHSNFVMYTFATRFNFFFVFMLI